MNYARSRAFAFMWGILALNACAPAPCEQQWGYYLRGESPSYAFQATNRTRSGIEVDASSNAHPRALADRVELATGQLEACLEKPIDRTSFRVKVPDDWGPSCDGSDEVLPFAATTGTCKGKTATEACPCRYRAVVQCSAPTCIVVVTPNLLLFKDALARLLTGSIDPWSDSSLAPCLSMGESAGSVVPR
jgi:hypothetical protein